MRATANGHAEVVKLLLDEGADPNVQDNENWTAWQGAVEKGKLDVVKQFLDKGADVNRKSDDGSTPLVWAAKSGHPDIVRLLRRHGAEMTLNIAAMLGDGSEVQRLLKTGTDVNKRNEGGRTALMDAAGKGHINVVKLLLDKGADVQAGTWDGVTALQSAKKGGHKEIVRLLKAHGAGESTTEKTGSDDMLTDDFVRGEVVASSPKTLEIQVRTGGSSQVIPVKVGLRTRFVPFRRPAVGERVEVEYHHEKGERFGRSVKVIE